MTTELKVGALVIAVTAILGGLTMKVSDSGKLFGKSKNFTFEVDDASGLIKKSAVKMVGIRVGSIEDIVLSNSKARVTISIEDDVPLTTSAQIEIRADGILGDKHVEIVPGNPVDPLMVDGALITNAKSVGSLETVMAEISKVTKTLGNLAENISRATEGNGDSSTPLGRIVLNVEKVTGDMAQMTGENKEKIGRIVNEVSNITATLDEMINDQSGEGFRSAWGNAVDSLKRIDNSLRNIEEVTEKINNGEGTIGRLVNDDETIEKINTTIDGVNEFIGGGIDLATSVDYHMEHLSASSANKSYLGFKIQPGLDRYYEFAVVDDPAGVISEKNTVESGSSSSDVTTVTTDKDRVKFNLQFAKNIYNFTFRGGLIESTGGIGIDYYAYGKKLKFTLEAFNFEDTNIKTFMRYDVYKGFYLIGGGNDLLDSQNSSAFLGAGLFLTNDDLKVLASKVSF